MAPRPCIDCGALTTSTRCRACGNTTRRGYGAAHQAARAAWIPEVATGTVRCARCAGLIMIGDVWDLGHTDDRTAYTGPEHAICNRGAPRRKESWKDLG